MVTPAKLHAQDALDYSFLSIDWIKVYAQLTGVPGDAYELQLGDIDGFKVTDTPTIGASLAFVGMHASLSQRTQQYAASNITNLFAIFSPMASTDEFRLIIDVMVRFGGN